MPVILQEETKKNTAQYKITVPKKLVTAEGYKKGQKFNWVRVQGLLAIEPVR